MSGVASSYSEQRGRTMCQVVAYKEKEQCKIIYMSAQKVVAVTFKGVLRLGKFCVLEDYQSLTYRIGGHAHERWSHMNV